ncbi:MAG: hypothetical protein EOO27_24850 [Comamonadaceae bacterium]|nr:MAG: hypothetical protein EOO27_24850 [Comamonadaceae bacterium]
MTTNRWESLPTTPIGHRGEVISLTAASTAQALAAYLAGPRFVQRVPRSHGLVREQIGDGPWRTRAADEEDIADVQEGLETFMHSLGLPAPPATDEWRLHLPQGLTSTDFAAAIDDPAIPAYTESNGREVVAAVTRRLEELLGPLD